jgi:hypothetical protein
LLRKTFIERILRQVYGEQPVDDASITDNLVNSYVNDGIGIAARQSYEGGIKIDGIGYVNNSFYTRFKDLSVSEDGNFIYKVTLPQIPIGLGRNEGISTLQFKKDGQVSLPCVQLSDSQKGYYQGLRPIPNKVLFYTEGKLLYAISTVSLNEYTATVSMVSGGDATDLDSELNVPDDYIPLIVEYVKKQLLQEQSIPHDVNNDGADNK